MLDLDGYYTNILELTASGLIHFHIHTPEKMTFTFPRSRKQTVLTTNEK